MKVRNILKINIYRIYLWIPCGVTSGKSLGVGWPVRRQLGISDEG